jgi:hypothetical protein
MGSNVVAVDILIMRGIDTSNGYPPVVGTSCPRHAIVSNAISLILRYSFFLYLFCRSTVCASTVCASI